MFAPHPDDESLVCSIPLQRAARAGATIRVVYVTDGDDNVWPQRFLERKWRLTEADRRAWATKRRSEALNALAVLGVSVECARFLGLADQQLTTLLLHSPSSVAAKLAFHVADVAPTHILMPALSDAHPDHSALGVLLRLALSQTDFPRTRIWKYLVHGRSPAFFRRAQIISYSNAEMTKKRAAIACHRTQLALSRTRFFRYAARPEKLLNDSIEATAEGSIRSALRQRDELRLRWQMRLKPFGAVENRLLVVARDVAGFVRCFGVNCPFYWGRIRLCEQTEELALPCQYVGNPLYGELRFTTSALHDEFPIFVKHERRSLFFDEAGWLEIPGLDVKAKQVSPTTLSAAVSK